MEHIQHRQAHAHNGQVEIGDVHGLCHLLGRPGDKPAQNDPAQQKHCGGDDHRGAQGDDQGGAHPLADALVLLRAQVLAHVGDHGVAVGGGRDFQNAVQLIAGGEAGDEQNAVGVDDKLHNHAADGDDAVLKCHGESQHQKTQGKTLLLIPKIRWFEA